MGIIDGLSSSSLFKNLSEERKEIIRGIGDALEPVFAKIFQVFEYFTPHGMGHIFACVENIERLLKKWNLELNPDQSFVMLLAAILHDIGMHPELFNDDPEGCDELRKREVRERHHERSARFIEESPLLKAIPDDLRRTAAKIAKAHRRGNLHTEEYDNDDALPEIKGFRFLSGLMRLSDELELTQKRVQFLDIFRDREDYLSSLPENARIHWEGHLSIQRWDLSNREEVIEVEGEVDGYQGHLGIELVREGLQETIEAVRTIRYEDRFPFPIACRFKIDFRRGTGKAYRVRLDTENTIDYLIQNLYTDIHTPLRELVQNGIDACRIMPDSGIDSKVVVSIDGNKVRITDNGMGMNLYVIDNYLKVVGRSYYQSPDFSYRVKKEGLQERACGRFGLGIFSTFMLADTLVVRTRHRRDGAFWYETRFSKSFCPTYKCDRPPESFEWGTQVEFDIKGTQINPSSILTYLQNKFLRPRVELVVRVDGETETIRVFPRKGDKIGNLQVPYVSYLSDGFRVHALAEDGVFVGILWKFQEKAKRATQLRVRDNIEVCLEGTLLDDVSPQLAICCDRRIRGNAFDLEDLKQLVDALNEGSDAFDEELSYVVVDFPKGLVAPNLSREQAAEPLPESMWEYVAGYLKRTVPGIVARLYRKCRLREREAAFWREIAKASTAEMFQSLDMEASVDLLSMWNIDEAARNTDSSVCQELSGNVPKANRKMLTHTLLCSLFDASPDQLVGWLPGGSDFFTARFAVPLLVRAGWSIIDNGFEPTCYRRVLRFRFDFAGDYWVNVTVLLDNLPTDDAKLLVKSLIPSILHQNPLSRELGWAGLQSWIRHKTIVENWNDIMKEFLDVDPASACDEILITQVYFLHRLRSYQARDALLKHERVKDSMKPFDRARLFSLIRRYDEALILLERSYQHEHQHQSTGFLLIENRLSYSDLTVEELEWIKNDFEGLEREKPSKFKEAWSNIAGEVRVGEGGLV